MRRFDRCGRFDERTRGRGTFSSAGTDGPRRGLSAGLLLSDERRDGSPSPNLLRPMECVLLATDGHRGQGVARGDSEHAAAQSRVLRAFQARASEATRTVALQRQRVRPAGGVAGVLRRALGLLQRGEDPRRRAGGGGRDGNRGRQPAAFPHKHRAIRRQERRHRIVHARRDRQARLASQRTGATRVDRCAEQADPRPTRLLRDEAAEISGGEILCGRSRDRRTLGPEVEPVVVLQLRDLLPARREGTGLQRRASQRTCRVFCAGRRVGDVRWHSVRRLSLSGSLPRRARPCPRLRRERTGRSWVPRRRQRLRHRCDQLCESTPQEDGRRPADPRRRHEQHAPAGLRHPQRNRKRRLAAFGRLGDARLVGRVESASVLAIDCPRTEIQLHQPQVHGTYGGEGNSATAGGAVEHPPVGLRGGHVHRFGGVLRVRTARGARRVVRHLGRVAERSREEAWLARSAAGRCGPSGRQAARCPEGARGGGIRR
jgi:hypothetical protein